MKEIQRPNYLQLLLDKRENGLIKVITGIRRCGKSYFAGFARSVTSDRLRRSEYDDNWLQQAAAQIGNKPHFRANSMKIASKVLDNIPFKEYNGAEPGVETCLMLIFTGLRMGLLRSRNFCAMRVKAVNSIALPEEFGNQLREPHSKAIEDGLFELRIKETLIYSAALSAATFAHLFPAKFLGRPVNLRILQLYLHQNSSAARPPH